MLNMTVNLWRIIHDTNKICNQQLSAMYQQINGIVNQLRDERKAPVSVANTSDN